MYTKRDCDYCKKEYLADNRNLNRGWGKTCSKSCAASLRECTKSTYNINKVAKNNVKRRKQNYRETLSIKKTEIDDEILRIKLKKLKTL